MGAAGFKYSWNKMEASANTEHTHSLSPVLTAIFQMNLS